VDWGACGDESWAAGGERIDRVFLATTATFIVVRRPLNRALALSCLTQCGCSWCPRRSGLAWGDATRRVGSFWDGTLRDLKSMRIIYRGLKGTIGSLTRGGRSRPTSTGARPPGQEGCGPGTVGRDGLREEGLIVFSAVPGSFSGVTSRHGHYPYRQTAAYLCQPEGE
jgi:hypothetical protein